MQTPAPFEYERAISVEGAIASLQKLGSDARIIAGGHSLLPMMKLRLAQPEHLIDINDLDELNYIEEVGDEVRIGALTRHVELLKSDVLARHFALFADAEQVIADPVVRNRGTIGGSLCQADAAEDLSSVCSAVKAKVVIRGGDGERVVTMEEFHVGPYMTAVGDGEMLTEVRIPLRAGAAARTRRSSGAPGTGRSRPPRRRYGSTRARSRTSAWRSVRSAQRRSMSGGPRSSCEAPRPRRSCSPRQRRSPLQSARRQPTAAGRLTTSATSPACSPGERCAAPPREPSDRRPDSWK